jgi:hypothetical protein
MRVARSASTRVSGPKIFTARSPRAPVSISETRISIGWVNVVCTPGRPCVAWRNCSTTKSLLPRHSPCGEHHEAVGFVEAHGIEADLVRSGAGDHVGHFGHGLERALYRHVDLGRLRQVDRGQLASCTITEPSSIVGMNVLPTAP